MSKKISRLRPLQSSLSAYAPAKSKECKSNLDSWFGHNLDLKGRVLFLGTRHYDSEGGDLGIDSLMAEDLIKGLYILNNNGEDPIRIIMNTPGGYTTDGWAIYDAIHASHAPVDIEVYGQAASMGAVILQAARERLIHPNAMVLVHDGYQTDKERTKIRDGEKWSKWNALERQRIYDIFSQRSGRSTKFWSEQCRDDSMYSAEKTVKYGLADRVLRPERKY